MSGLEDDLASIRLERKPKTWSRLYGSMLCRRVDAKMRLRKKRLKNRVAARKFIARKYGLSVDQYNQMVVQQRGLCAICHLPETARRREGVVQFLSIDHCHATGKVRGLLCLLCNAMLGNAQDSPDRLRAAAMYLERAR